MFTFIVHKFLNFFLHNSQKCITFAPYLKTLNTVTIAVKLKPQPYEFSFFYIQTASAGFCPAFVRRVPGLHYIFPIPHSLLYLCTRRHTRTFVPIIA